MSFQKNAIVLLLASFSLSGFAQFYDGESGYTQNHHRDYDSSTGRYLQYDPRGVLLDFSAPERQVAAQMGIAIPDPKEIGYINHGYIYTDNNPVNKTDPTGENISIPLNMPSIPGSNAKGSATNSPDLLTCEQKCWSTLAGNTSLGVAAGAGIGSGINLLKGGIQSAAQLANHYYSGASSAYDQYSLGKCLKECRDCEK